MSKNVKKPSAVKEFFRKQIVTLKRNPQNIPMAMLLISFVYYSLNLTNMSNTTAKIQGVGMGLCQFCIMLFSLLSIVCMLNAFPSRKKPVYPMVALMFAMFGIIIYADIHYCNAIMAALTRAESPIVLDVNTINMKKKPKRMGVHAGYTSEWKKAIVTLTADSKTIEFFDGMK